MEIDYTQLQTYITCPMKYYLKFVLGLKKRVLDERDIDLRFGQAVHKCLELHYKNPGAGLLPTKPFNDFVDLEGEKHKTKANGIELIRQYGEHYQKDLLEMEILGVELNDSILIGDLRYLVKIDTVVRLRDNIYILEHKTCKKMAYNYFNQFSPNMQVSGYSLYVKEKFGQCSGCIVNVLQSGWRERAYRGEPAGFYAKFQREIVNRTKEQLEDFKENIGLWKWKLQTARQTSRWGKNEGACHQYRGCLYSEICMTSQGIELDEEIVDNFYKNVNPREYLENSTEKR